MAALMVLELLQTTTLNGGCDIDQEAVIKTISMIKKCKKAKWLSKEALQTAEKRREAKGKGERKDTQLNAEFPRIERRDRKPSSVVKAKQ